MTGVLFALGGLALLVLCKGFARGHAEWYRSTTGKEADEALSLIGPLVAGLLFLFIGLGVAAGVISFGPRGSGPPPSNDGLPPTSYSSEPSMT
jgi:hypothetical protein